MSPVTTTSLTCPQCHERSDHEMPTDSCQYFLECPTCHTLLRPVPGDCCVFCSYGDVRCPSRQVAMAVAGSEEPTQLGVDGETPTDPGSVRISAWAIGLALAGFALAVGFSQGARSKPDSATNAPVDTAAAIAGAPSMIQSLADDPIPAELAERATGETSAAPASVPTVNPTAEGAPIYVPANAETEPEGLLAAEEGRLETPALVMFHAEWCHVCQEAMPIVHELRQQYAGKVAILKMNVDDPASAPAAARYRVAGTPTFVLFDRHGQVVQHVPGWVGKVQTEAMLARVSAMP